jgi:hypothetical protein
LRTARGGKSFDAAWDAALEIARDREFAQIHANLSALSAAREAGEAAATAGASGHVPSHMPGRIVPRLNGPHPDARYTDTASLYGETLADDSVGDRREYLETCLRTRDRLTRARRLLLMRLSNDPAQRAAWETLVGPVDWDRAERCESQADEPFADPSHEHYEGYDSNPHQFGKPGMLLTAEAGFLSDFTGGHDATAEMAAEVEEFLRDGEPGEGEESE